MSRRISKQPHKIMHLMLNLDIGGLERVVVNLLRRLPKDRFNPMVACILNAGPLAEEVQDLGLEVEILHKPERLDFSVSWKLARILRKRNISLVHTHNTGAFLYGTVAARLAVAPCIVHTEHGRNFPDKKRLMVAERILAAFTHKIITVSEDLKKALVEFEKIDPQKIEVIPNGIDLDLFRPFAQAQLQKKRDELCLDKTDVVIGTVGRLAQVKDHKTLIEAFSLVHKNTPQANLVIVGDGPLKESLKLKVKSLKLENKVRFLGERKEIPELLNLFDVFVLPSKSEGISLTLLEAMATARPVVATAVGGNREIITDGIDGYLVPSENPQRLTEAILKIVNNPQEAKRLAHQALKKTKDKFSLEKMVDKYQRIYESALVRN